jgi:hypothetical protein
MHFEHAAARLERDRLTVLSDLGLRLRRPHAFAVHAHRTGAGRHRATAPAAATPVATAAPTAVPAALIPTTLPLGTGLKTALAGLTAESLTASRTPPLRHG